MFNIRYNGLRLIPSKSAGEELLKYGLMIEDCKDILENGYAPRKRGRDTIEKWMESFNQVDDILVMGIKI